MPAKFTLTNGSARITDAVAKLYAAKVTDEVVDTEAETSSRSPASLDNLFRYNATSENHISNRSTKGLMAGTCQLRINLADWVSRPVRVSLR